MAKNHKITIPTYITLTRFILVPLFVYFFLNGQYIIALVFLGSAGLTDALDGFIARRFNMRSQLGSLLDPIADKFLMLVTFIMLSVLNKIPWALTILVIGRDIYITHGAILLYFYFKRKLFFKPTVFSKLTTVFQIFVLLFCFLDITIERLHFNLNPVFLHYFKITTTLLILTAMILTALTAIQYTYIGYKFLRFGEKREGF